MNVQTTRRPFAVGTDFHIADTTLQGVSAVDSMSGYRLAATGFVFVWFFLGGIAHFVATDIEMRLVPPYIPWPREAVLLSGALELIGAFGLLSSRTRKAAGIGLFVLTLAVTPVHIYMLQVPELFASIPRWSLWLRLPIQVALLVLIAWCTSSSAKPRRLFALTRY